MTSQRRSQGSRYRTVESRTRAPGPGPRIGPVRITPLRVLLAVAIVGSIGYLAYAVTVRDTTSIPMLASGAVVLGGVFTLVAIFSVVAMRRSSIERHDAAAIGFAIGGGLAAMVAAGCFAGAVVASLLWGS